METSPPKGMKNSRTPWTTKLRPEMRASLGQDKRTGKSLLIPTPLLIAAEVSQVPPGRLITPARLREKLAAAHRADLTCPLCTGIFLNILAGAAEEQIAKGEAPLAPYWRVVAENGSLSEKFPPGTTRQAEHLAAEGVPTSSVRGKLRVTDPQALMI